MRAGIRLLVGAALLVALAIAPGLARADGPLGVTIFYSSSSGPSTVFREEVWPAIAEEYGERLSITEVDIGEAAGKAALEDVGERLGVDAPEAPAAVVGDALLFDPDPERLGEAVRAAIAERVEAGGSAEPGEAAVPDACSDCARDPLAPDAPAPEFPGLIITPWDDVPGDGGLRVTIYYSPTCGHCTIFREEVWPAIAEEYGERLDVTLVDVSVAEGMAALEATEARLGVRAPDIPVVVVGADAYLYDLDMQRLGEAVRGAIEEGLAAGGTRPAGESPAPTQEPAAGSGAAIHLAYVEKDGCSECARARLVLDALQAEFPTLAVATLNSVRDAPLVEAIGAHLGLPEAERLVAPSLYVGDRALLDDEITLANVRVLLAEYAPTGAPAFWETLEAAAGRESIVARFGRMGPLAVVAAALLDGINPCAFATILFFVSYLAVSRRPRRDLLFIGLAFTGGVFITYLLVGLGAMQLLRLASAIRIVGPILYGAMAVGCLVLAGLSLYDYVLARRGQLKDMRLNLPEGLRERIKGRIRAASGAYVGAAFGSGLIVSLLELACTGQVYLPTISFMVSVPQMRGSAIGYLLLYNAAFIVPLVVVLLLAVYGVSAAHVQDWFVRNAARTKLLMAVLFAGLAGLLATQVVAL